MINRTKKKKKSLAKGLRNMVVRIALIIFLICTLMCWLFLSFEFTLLMEINAQSLVTGIKAFLDEEGHFEEYASSVMETYRNIPEEIRKDPQSEAYRACFEKYRVDGYAGRVSKKLLHINNSIDIQNVYIIAFDPEHEAIVYLLDYSVQTTVYPLHEIGEWTSLTDELREEILSSGYPIRSIRETDESESEGTEGTTKFDRFISFETSRDGIGKIQTGGMEAYRLDDGSSVYIMCAMPVVFSNVTTAIFIVAYFLILTVVIIIIVVLTRIRLRKKVIRPINSISQAVEEYAKNRTEGKTTASCFSSLSINTRDELEDLAGTLIQMEKDLGEYEKDLKTAVAREERMNTELSVATGIQSHMLPDAKDSFPDRKDFSISASMTPAREVGGDFYDFFLIDEDHLGIVIADVSGKGIPAALFMMSSMIVINNFACMGFSPAEVLRRSNEKICASNVLDMFVTVWFGILDLKTGVVTAANAGHEYPALRGGSGGFELLHDKHGFVVGGMEGVRYKEYTFTMEKGGMLFLYTDGVPEATNASNELYGTDRMIRLLSSAEDQSPEGLDKALRDDIHRFIGGAPQFDDLTTLCVQYHPE